MHKKLVALLCFGLMITIAGCGASNPPTTPVTGQVKYDGEALEGATVTLTPEAGSADTRTASGITDADGNFTLTTVLLTDKAQTVFFLVPIQFASPSWKQWKHLMAMVYLVIQVKAILLMPMRRPCCKCPKTEKMPVLKASSTKLLVLMQS